MQNKDEVLETILAVMEHHNNQPYHNQKKLFEKLYITLTPKPLLDLSDDWSYQLLLSASGVSLVLAYQDSPQYKLLTIPSHQLSLDEYGTLYNVEGNTVRQWIRRGKIPTAVKYGTDWRIPEGSKIVEDGIKVFHKADGVTVRIYKGFEAETKAKNWLVDVDEGDKNLEQMVMTAKEKEKFELTLVADPEVQYDDVVCIKDNLKPGQNVVIPAAPKKEIRETKKRRKYTMEPARVNNQEDAEALFEKYDIPYEKYTRGENKGKLKVKTIRDLDGRRIREAMAALEEAGYGDYVDHSNCFRDAEDETVVTFSPYAELFDVHMEDGVIIGVPKEIRVPGYEVVVEKLDIYGGMTDTLVMRRKY